MPLYEYECEACNQRFEVIQKYSDPSPDACEKCGKGPVRRLMSSPAIQFKGSGFYITDYPKKGNSDATAAAKAGSGSTSDAGAKSDVGSKSESASTSDSASKSDSGSKSESSSKSDASTSSTSTSPSTSTTKKE